LLVAIFVVAAKISHSQNYLFALHRCHVVVIAGVVVSVVVAALNLYGIHICCTWKTLGWHRLKIVQNFGTREVKRR